MEKVLSLAIDVKSTEQYIAICNSLFRDESDIKNTLVWELFTFFYFIKNNNQPQIKSAYRHIWWELFTRFSVKNKCKLIYWRCYRHFCQLHWSDFVKHCKSVWCSLLPLRYARSSHAARSAQNHSHRPAPCMREAHTSQGWGRWFNQNPPPPPPHRHALCACKATKHRSQVRLEYALDCIVSHFVLGCGGAHHLI